MRRQSVFVFLSLLACSVALNCTAIGEQLCSKDDHCAAFGVYGTEIQLHGCTSTVPNTDWTIFVRNSGNNYTQLPGTINVDETACAQHPDTGMQHACEAPPPPPGPALYEKQGSIDVGTFENTIFYWQGVLYNLENIPCSYWDHAGIWDASFGNHSYARVRVLDSGHVVSNISSSTGFGFISAFPDYETGIVWLFGTPADRCTRHGPPKTVQAWWSTDLLHWSSALVFDYGQVTHNVQVTKVGPLGGASPADYAAFNRTQRAPRASQLPPHRYAMYLECFAWAINNNADGNLTHGWTLLPNTRAPPGAPCGGPSMNYSPLDGYYYILTGGQSVFLYRTQDFLTWQESSPSPFIAPSEQDAAIAPFSDFPTAAATKGSPPNAHVGIPEPFPRRPFKPYWMGSNWTSWSHNSNDGDFCCMHTDVPNAYIVWGASTQGKSPSPPLDGTDVGTNSIGVASMPLDKMLSAYFPAASLET